MTLRLFLIVSCVLFQAHVLAGELSFVVAKGVMGSYSVEPPNEMTVVSVTQQLGHGFVNRLTIRHLYESKNLRRLSFKLSHQPDDFGSYNTLEVTQEYNWLPTGEWYEFSVSKEKNCSPPPPKMTVVLDVNLLEKADQLAKKIGWFFKVHKNCSASELQKIAPTILEALDLPVTPGFQVSETIKGYWVSDRKREGTLECLDFSSRTMTWFIRHSVWNQGLLIQLIWNNSGGAKAHLLTITKLDGHIVVTDCTQFKTIRLERAEGLIELSERLLVYCREYGTGGKNFALLLKDEISEQMRLSLDDYLTD